MVSWLYSIRLTIIVEAYKICAGLNTAMVLWNNQCLQTRNKQLLLWKGNFSQLLITVMTVKTPPDYYITLTSTDTIHGYHIKRTFAKCKLMFSEYYLPCNIRICLISRLDKCYIFTPIYIHSSVHENAICNVTHHHFSSIKF